MTAIKNTMYKFIKTKVRKSTPRAKPNMLRQKILSRTLKLYHWFFISKRCRDDISSFVPFCTIVSFHISPLDFSAFRQAWKILCQQIKFFPKLLVQDWLLGRIAPIIFFPIKDPTSDSQNDVFRIAKNFNRSANFIFS